MAILQGNFVEDPAYGFPGMEADGELSNIITRTLESGTLAFGKPVYRGTADRGCVTTPAAGALYGFAIANKGLPVTSARAADTFAQGDSVRIKNRGKIWVLPGVNVADGEQVYVTSAGVITNVSTSNVIADGWSFDDTALSGAPVRIVRR
ncbi:hypothetical protein PX699_13365 [Sphingobium sp. H39-3-25]|uniref:structural cement protein Gp24 n=1 Tax=Sphingobium arseniciresistens TaxID=3030834 RepID=UPI0023BA0AB4|nr:hypothetical protein [Sphingobium arseniciresistens]